MYFTFFTRLTPSMRSREFEVFWSHKGKNKNAPRHQAARALALNSAASFFKSCCLSVQQTWTKLIARCVRILRPTSKALHVCMVARILCLLLWIANKCSRVCMCTCSSVECGCVCLYYVQSVFAICREAGWRRSFVWLRLPRSMSAWCVWCIARIKQTRSRRNPQRRAFYKRWEMIWTMHLRSNVLKNMMN